MSVQNTTCVRAKRGERAKKRTAGELSAQGVRRGIAPKSARSELGIEPLPKR